MSDNESEPSEPSTLSTPASPTAKCRFPKLVCFDLDYTLWPLWVDTHVDPPLKRRQANAENLIYDRNGQKMSFYRDVPAILLQLKNDPNVLVTIASRTSAPRAAEQALDQLLIPSGVIDKDKRLMRAIECFDIREIYPGSKIRHFKEIHKKTGVPYEEMVFFDDESRNKEVSSLGVTFVLVPEGVNRSVFETGIADWRKAREAQESRQVFEERRPVEKKGKR